MTGPRSPRQLHDWGQIWTRSWSNSLTTTLSWLSSSLGKPSYTPMTILPPPPPHSSSLILLRNSSLLPNSSLLSFYIFFMAPSLGESISYLTFILDRHRIWLNGGVSWKIATPCSTLQGKCFPSLLAILLPTLPHLHLWYSHHKNPFICKPLIYDPTRRQHSSFITEFAKGCWRMLGILWLRIVDQLVLCHADIWDFFMNPSRRFNVSSFLSPKK